MPYINYGLPSYPLLSDMWDELKKEERPIMVYGMGNGADKLFSRLCKYGIEVKEVFASDGFVRGHSYRGYLVRSFSEIKENYKDFVILLSFASNRPEVIDMLSEIDGNWDMYVPDMPVAGVEEYFDREFYNSHYKEILRAYNSLEDEGSRAIFSSVVNYKLTGKMSYLISCYSTKDELYSIMPGSSIVTAVDAGAYNGDTAKEMSEYLPALKRIYAIEPDKKNFKKLERYSLAEKRTEIIPINAAAWCENSCGVFFGSGNRNSTVVATASFEHSLDEVPMITVDEISQNDKIHYVKYDVEGAEQQALDGSMKTIERDRPTLLISLYHRSRDIFEIINRMADRQLGYRLYLRRLRCLPAWEIDLICINE